MMAFDVVVSGHLCADLLPETSHTPASALSSPGRLFEVGPLTIATGGAVSNTGLALHRLGVKAGLMTSVGDDLMGQVIIAKLREEGDALGDCIRVRQNDSSSYSVILSPENIERIILHCPGSNAHFDQNDIDFDIVRQSKLFHLGYPPLLPRLFADEGDSLLEIYRKAYDTGVVTSLDTSHPDPHSASGQVDWEHLLRRVLPYVDIFLPSIEEIVFMMRRADYDAWQGKVLCHLSRSYLRDLADEQLALGSTITGFKLGPYGLYLRTSPHASHYRRFERIGLDTETWRDLDLWHPAFEVNVMGTTGAGDCAYGAFFAALLRGLGPGDALRLSCAVGACNVEAHDATSGVLSWDATLQRIERGWSHSQLTLLD